MTIIFRLSARTPIHGLSPGLASSSPHRNAGDRETHADLVIAKPAVTPSYPVGQLGSFMWRGHEVTQGTSGV